MFHYRYGETLSVDDIVFSCAYLNVFFDRLKKEKVSVSVRMNFMKSIRHFIKWVEQFINPGKVMVGKYKEKQKSNLLRFVLSLDDRHTL